MKPTCLFAGRATLDMVYVCDRFPEEDSKVMSREVVIQAGGPALNGAITFAFLGGEATLLSAVGETPSSQLIREELAERGVRLIESRRCAGVAPPISSVVLNETAGTRTIFNAPDPVCGDDWSDVDSAEKASMVLVDGFYVAQIRGLLRTYAARGVPVCLDAGSWKATTEDLLPLVSIAVCGERFRPPGTRTPADVFDFLASRGIDRIAMTRGGESILGWDCGRSFELEIEPVKAVDTLGAGDILHGAFCWFYLAGEGFQRSLLNAARVASESCRYVGAREWMRFSKG